MDSGFLNLYDLTAKTLFTLQGTVSPQNLVVLPLE